MPLKENRTEFIKARLTPDERIQAEQTAAMLNVTMSDLIRLLILEGTQDRPSGLSADDRNTLNLILRYLQQIKGAPISPEMLTAVLGQLGALIQRIDDT
ncbi:plasmid mobilization protein [Rhodopila sp.]|uniref:plasmid mobilization protein n=1 Tax=Rhodopila sp. TaxID=2480087 RepID=UPI003D0BF2A2